jgi:hypothetical protein
LSYRQLELPSFKVTSAILRKTTERLVREVEEPTARAPDWHEVEWVIARAVAAMQGISVLLAKRLKWSGPALWQSFLQEQHAHSVLFSNKIGSTLARLDAALSAADCSAMALKGSAIRELGIYEPGERSTADIDLLASARDVARIEPVICSLGYQFAYKTRRHSVFVPRVLPEVGSLGEHVDNPLKIEVHTKIAEALPIREVDISDEIGPSGRASGLSSYPSVGALILHLLLHTAGNMRRHVARHIQFNDIAMLAGRLSASDWSDLVLGHTDGSRRWWVYPPLFMTDRYYPGAVPRDVLSEARMACPRALRRWIEDRTMTDVTWSNFRIYAFPGMAWSRSFADSMSFIRSRLLPSKRSLAELDKGFQAEVNQQQVSWYGISHRSRILRWVVSQPPRVQTMYVIRAHLDDVNAKLRPVAG